MSGLRFLDSFFEDEVRDGFFVSLEIKRAWAAELEVLYEVDKVCRKHHISYFADWGTLLASVRHEGYIPWDDDLDIVMKRKDYERFMKLAPKELPEGFSAYNFHNHEDFWLFLGRVVGKQRICFEEDHLKRFHQFPYIAGVDIFVLDYVCRDEEREQKRNKLAMSVLALADGIGEGKYDEMTVQMMLSKFESESGFKIDRRLTGNTLRRELYGVAEKLFAWFSETESDELTQLFPFGLKDKNFRFSKEFYQRSVCLKYENTTIPVPELYDQVLLKRYGEYMHLIRNVGGHDYPFFSIQHKQLLEVLDFELPEYRYDQKTAGRQPVTGTQDTGAPDTFKGIVRGYCDAVKEVSEQIAALAEPSVKTCGKQGDKNNTGFDEKREKIQSLCAELQQLAIDFGGLIEQFRGEGFVTVSCLEELCTAVYYVYEAAGENPAKTEQMLQICERLYRNVETNILSRKEIVFMPDHPAHWEGFEAVFREVLQDEKNDVYVIPIPYDYKNYDGSTHDRQYMLSGYPEDVLLTSYEEYEWEVRHPDMIYIQNPYDEWHVATIVPEYFFSRNLLKYTDRLVYIPWFHLETFTPDCEREYYNMKYYCTMPGVVNADQVIVESETMRENYIRKLTSWAGKKTKEVWEQKIQCRQVPDRQTQRANTGTTSVSSAPVGSPVVPALQKEKKTIIYYIQLSSFLEHREKMIKKLHGSLEIFKESDISMVWIMEEQAESELKRIAPGIYGQYLKEKEYCITQVGRFMLRSDESDCAEVIRQADAYYGDRGRIALEFEVMKKPVMIQDVNVG